MEDHRPANCNQLISAASANWYTLAEDATGRQDDFIRLDAELDGLMDIYGGFTSVWITVRDHCSTASV